MKFRTGIIFALAFTTSTAFSLAPAAAEQKNVGCMVVDVATFTNRIHIHCPSPSMAFANLANNPQTMVPPYFAIEVTSPAAQGLLQIGQAGLLFKRGLIIFYDTDMSQNPAGCNQNDCRRLLGAELE